MRKKFPQPEYYTVEEVTDKYGITRDALYQYVRGTTSPPSRRGDTSRSSNTR
jgi:hypothetical protein